MAEGLEDFDPLHGPRVPLKAAINFKDMVDGKGFRFEVDKDNCFDCYDGSESSGDEEGPKGRAKETKFFDDPEYQWQPEDGSIRLDEPIHDYTELETQMESIHESNKIKKKTLKRGNNIVCEPDAKIFIRYAGFAEGKSDAFDKVCGPSRRSMRGIFLGGQELVYGLRVGLKTMSIGEVARFLIHPEYAFGVMGCPPRIPANARIVFTVELLSFLPKEKFADVLFMSVDDRAQLPFGDILQAAKSCKSQGNSKYFKQDFQGALKLYSRGIMLLEDYPTANEEENNKRDAELPELCCNKAQCLLKLNSPERACVACKLGLRCTDDITRPKLLFRFAEAKYMLESYEDALKFCNEALKMFRAQGFVQEKHQVLREKIKTAMKEQREKEAYLCQKMLKLTPVTPRPQVNGNVKTSSQQL